MVRATSVVQPGYATLRFVLLLYVVNKKGPVSLNGLKIVKMALANLRGKPIKLHN